MTPTVTLPNLMTPKQFAVEFPIMPLGGLRWLLFNKEANGLLACGAVLRLGPRRLLINPEKFIGWIEGQQSEGGGNNGRM